VSWQVAHIDELEALPVDDEGLTWRPIRRRFGITAFGTNAYTAERAGQRVVEEHRESGGHEELYVVVAGRATFTLDGEEVDAPAGTLVFCKPDTLRGAIAAEDGTTVLGVGAKPGAVFEPSAWEESFAGNAYARMGQLDRARETFRAATETHPDGWQAFYNWACVEALHGDRGRALTLLDRAIELDAKALEYAAGDEDFASLREDPDFLRITRQA
jgi:tetratricopeptide (TPR) repeat protein